VVTEDLADLAGLIGVVAAESLTWAMAVAVTAVSPEINIAIAHFFMRPSFSNAEKQNSVQHTRARRRNKMAENYDSTNSSCIAFCPGINI
jgi:hypothetical protein